MKRTYIAPMMTMGMLEATEMLAASLTIDNGGSVPADEVDVKSHGDWDSIWDNAE